MLLGDKGMYDYKDMYENLKEEFETYQNFAESNIQMLNEKNTRLEKNLDALVNIVEISKYINSYLSDDNLIPMINDMIIGILGVNYSSIYLRDGEKLLIKASNKPWSGYKELIEGYFGELQNGEPFVINCRTPIFETTEGIENIRSLVGVPIYLRDSFTGYIIVEHTIWNFFNYDHIKFVASIANQIGLALENNFLYNKVKESAIRDPLLGIYNRKFFFDFVKADMNRNPQNRFAIVMMDMDNFKKANDIYGHQFGDEVLLQTVSLIKENMALGDIAARYGGEEVVIYIKNVESHECVFNKIDSIRERISTNYIEYGNIKKNATASFGISYYPEDGATLEKVLNTADSLLYEAKNNGKNRVMQLY
jgi:diguanylate cyclase (GGDEF)-like protein